MGRDTVQIETAVNTISQEYQLEFTSEYGIPEALHPELPGPEDRIVDFPEGKVGVYTKFFEFSNFRLPISQFLFDILGYYQIHLSQLSVIGAAKAGEEYPPMLYQALGLSKKLKQPFFWVDERVFLTVVDWRTSAPKDGMPAESMYSVEAVRALDTHRTPIQKQPEMLLCLVGISRRYYLGDEVYGPVQFNPCPESQKGNRGPRGAAARGRASNQCSRGRPSGRESRKRGHDRADANAPLNVLRRDHADPRPTGSTRGGKSLAAIELGMASTRPVAVPERAPVDVSDPDPLSFADPWSRHPADVAQSSQGTVAAGDPESENASFASAVGSSESIYRPEWGVANGSLLDTLEACQDLVDHVAPPGYFSELRHLHNDEFLRQYNVNQARQVAMRSQLIQAREHEIKNLEALLEAEADMKKAAEDKSARLSQELEDIRALFLDLQVRNNHLTQQVATLQEHVSREEKLKAAFEEFKRYEDSRIEQRCAEMDTRLDALSIDFDEELYPHMLTAITGRRWMIGHGLRLAVMKCGECLELRQAFADVVSAGIAKGMSEGLRHGALKDLKYPLVDQLEGLKDAPMDVIMAALYLESDNGDDASQWVRDLRPSSSQLTIPVYPKVRDPVSPWACKEEMLLVDAIATNVSRAEKKKKCRIVCRTHGVGSAHHARSDGVPVFVPTVVPQGLALLLADAATQTDTN
nr:hypothetical protein [Tanacetum cinerariifolium]